MLNRVLFLVVAFIAPVCALAVLVSVNPVGAIAFVDRIPCLGLALVALALGAFHMRALKDPLATAEAAMWWGLASFLLVAAYATPKLPVWALVALLSLAGTSIARLASRSRRVRVAPSPFGRRIFA